MLADWSVMSGTEIIERPEVKDKEADTGSEFFHYVDKNKMVESAVFGVFVEALCGEKFPVTEASKPGCPVCPRCKEIYDSFRDE